MNKKRPSFSGSDTIARLAKMLDDDPQVTTWKVQQDFLHWRIWWSKNGGVFHARRNDPSGRFDERPESGRRYHIAASSLGRLVVLLLAQEAADAIFIEENGAIEVTGPDGAGPAGDADGTAS